MSIARLRVIAIGAIGGLLAGTAVVVGAAPALAVPPVVIGPVGSVSGVPTLTWRPVDQAVTYDVQVASNPSFSGPLVNVTTVQEQYVPTRELPTGTTLYWHVRVSGSGDDWSPVTTFTRDPVAPPTITAPAPGARLQQPESPPLLQWTVVAGATSYEVQYGTDPNFVDQTSTRTTRSPSYVVDLQAPGTFSWRVRGVLADGVFTGWSTPSTYVMLGLHAPEGDPVYPVNDVDVAIQDVELDWRPIAGAKTYDLQVSTDDRFLTIVHARTGIIGTRYSPPQTLANDQYYWRIRPVDSAGNKLDWAQVPTWAFQRNYPDQSSGRFPLDSQPGGDGEGTIVTDPFYFQWAPVARASSYTVEVSTSASFNPESLTKRCTTVHTTIVMGNGGACFPDAGGTYWWRVMATDEYSSAAPHTDVIAAPKSKFTYNPGLVVQTGPASGSTPSIPTLSWRATAGAARYRVEITGPTTDLVVFTSALTYTPTSLPAGDYRWDVRTVGQDGRIGVGRVLASRPTFGVVALPTEPEPMTTAPDALPVDPTVTYYRFPNLRWEPVVGAGFYRIRVRPLGSIAWSSVAGDFRYAAGEDSSSTFLEPGTYEWQVDAFKGSVINTGSIGRFTIATLPAVSTLSHRAALTGNALTGQGGTTVDACNAGLPATCQNLRQTPVLAWSSPNPNVGYYKLILSRDRELTNRIGTPINVSNTMWMPTASMADSQAGSAYFWVVLPCTAEEHCSPVQYADHAFNKQSRPVQLTSPADGAEVADDVTLRWQDYLTSERVVDGPTDPDLGTPLDTPGETEARLYRVQTSADPNFEVGVTSTDVDQLTFTSFTSTYPEGTTYWRVQAVDGSGNTSAWSPTWSFVKRSPVPQLSAPANGATVAGTSTLSWLPLDHAASYVVDIHRNGDTTGNTSTQVFSPVTTNRIGYVLDNLDPAQGPYAWRVRRNDAAGRPGDWSAWRTFQVSQASVPLTSPAENALVAPSAALFVWQPVAGAKNYRFERRVKDASAVSESVTTPTTQWAPTASIAGGEWQWRVVALDAAGNSLGAAPWTPFTVVDTPVATVPVSIAGATGSTAPVDSTITLRPATWNMPLAELTITYAWFRSGRLLPGVTGETYDVTADDLGQTITVRATATRHGYKTGTSTSNGVGVGQAPAPAATIPVTMSGSGQFGTTLTATPPTWNVEGVTTTLQWLRDGVAVAGQTGPTYAVTTADVGRAVSVRATGTKGGYTNGVSTSAAVVATQATAVSPTRAPVVSGVAAAKETLTVDPGDWPGAASKTFTYQWFVGGEAVAKETGKTYVVRTRDAGLPVSARVTMTMTGFAPSVATSTALTVERLSSTITATALSRKLTQRQRARLTVKVEMLGLDTTLGQVQVKDGAKVIATVDLKTGKDGELTIRLKKLKLGRHKLTVAYLGSTSTLPSSTGLKLKVVKGTKAPK